ncbi:PAQR family membrane homeostasis protein TrhA [Acetanaerobacterium elongatum]|uniref:Hemolysin III n=1 Tax=Acetanaerobacterium elongatum TaxID=258515 RepID=A0A1G9ZJ35_9FIRM|nr:hemolysin III family protein [Acetanaerobacterium elongatum]SDN21492.1 hemolysin III [Acetanaerobacterium elongatum]
MLHRAKDEISFLTHFIGALLCAFGTILLAIKPLITDTVTIISLLAALVFGVSLILLYTASATYHFTKGSEKLCTVLRKIDHSMIYVLIAGTYTPVCMLVFSQPKGLYFCIALWCVAILGILFKVCWINCPRAISVTLYLLMGWSILLDIPAMLRFSVGGRVFLILGGVFYTVGAIIYAIKKPNISKKFGFHELFHVFVMLGSLMHFTMVYAYIL